MISLLFKAFADPTRLLSCLGERFAEIADLRRDRAKLGKILKAKEKCS